LDQVILEIQDVTKARKRGIESSQVRIRRKLLVADFDRALKFAFLTLMAARIYFFQPGEVLFR